MERSVLLPGGSKIAFYGINADIESKEFVRIWNVNAIERCKCTLVEVVKKGEVPGCLKAPGTSPFFDKLKNVCRDI